MSDWCSCNPLSEAQAKAAKWDAIVRCKDCALFYLDDDGYGCCENNYAGLWDGTPDSFCSWGRAKGEGMNEPANRELRDVDEASCVRVEKDYCMCVLFRWYSEITGEWFTSVNVTFPDGSQIHAGMSQAPCTEESAFTQIERAKAFVATEGLNWRVDDGD